MTVANASGAVRSMLPMWMVSALLSLLRSNNNNINVDALHCQSISNRRTRISPRIFRHQHLQLKHLDQQPESVASILQDPGTKAFEEQPPHSGCHFRPTHPGTPTNHRGPKKSKRFFEGWYYRVTIPKSDDCRDPPVSFAFIVSIEDPFENGASPLSLACHQIMGPNDEYLVQSDPDHTKFWAWQGRQALGCVFDYNEGDDDKSTTTTTTAIDPDEWNDQVRSGFQILPDRIQGKLIGHDGSLGGVGPNQGIPGDCTYDVTITPLAGWGDAEVGQKSTAGWLASYKVFEPHWQVTMADGRASGCVTWKGKQYTFVDAPFYAEKNWGGAFPIRWYWCQCNSFDGFLGNGRDRQNQLSVTAGGGTRKIPFGQKESLGMVSVHHNGVFYEATPWVGDMTWSISPWGSWVMAGRCTGGVRPFEVELEAYCDAPGVVLRAPTEYDGMQFFCRDSFLANVTLSLWELERDLDSNTFKRGRVIVDKAKSSQGAVEVGGGPWWSNWSDASKMKQPMKGMVRLPYRLANLRNRIFRGRPERSNK